jgi:hypothetical protein
MCYVLFSYACILIGQVFVCRYIFIAMYSFVPSFREAKFCGVPSCVFGKLWCAAGEKRLRNTDICIKRIYFCRYRTCEVYFIEHGSIVHKIRRLIMSLWFAGKESKNGNRIMLHPFYSPYFLSHSQVNFSVPGILGSFARPSLCVLCMKCINERIMETLPSACFISETTFR